jgi:N-sulfoglucosamine sulfohydrolase
MPDRPNVLFAFADDWGRYAGAYAALEGPNSINALIETPNFDRVAEEGVLFRNAFVPAPSCTPCRSSLLSGQYFWQTGLGAILLGAVWDETIPTYPLELEKAGYHIGYTYKVWSPGRTNNAPYGAKRTQYQPAGHEYGRFSHVATERAKALGVGGAKQSLLDETRGNFDAFLESVPEGKPFCYWWGPTNTHRSWERGSGKALWGLEPDDLKGRLPAFLPDVHEVREDVCDYLGECLAVDAGLGVLLERLEETGQLDNTLVVVSGDHGIPGVPRAKCNLYNIGCEVALAMRWPGEIPPGRVVDDFVNLMDLAPTFLEAGGAEVPETMCARSLMPVMTSDDEGQIDPKRDFVVTGRERHVDSAREGYLPYPQRALRTRDFLYVRNFAPDRWPMGDPKGLDDPNAEAPDYDKLAGDTFAAYPDMDAGPTKAWMIHHRNEESVRTAFELGFGKRPGEELYDLRTDPHYMHNVAEDSEYAKVKQKLSKRLMRVLTEHDDPRVVETPCRYEHVPYAGPVKRSVRGSRIDHGKEPR